MSQSSPSKIILLHPIENHRKTGQKGKTFSHHTTENIATHTDPTEFHRDTATNTPNYTEQVAKALDNGDSTEDIAQMLIQNEASESYWKLITERRQQAIEETVAENQQLHNLIDDLSKDNEQLRVLSTHCDYLQNVLNSFTNEHESILDNSSTN